MKNTKRPGRAGLVAAAVIALVVTGCTPTVDGLPVHAEVEWEGRNTGPHEDDPYVVTVRDFAVQMYAASNALNFSQPGLAEVTSNDLLEDIPSFAEAWTSPSPGDTPILRLWEGPPSFSVMDIKQEEYEVEVIVCQRLAPWWSLNQGWPRESGADRGELVEEKDGAFRFEPPGYQLYHYVLIDLGDGWKVHRYGRGTKQKVSEDCDPGEVAVGTYATQPDLDLLHTATPDMIVGPDGRPVED